MSRRLTREEQYQRDLADEERQRAAYSERAGKLRLHREMYSPLYEVLDAAGIDLAVLKSALDTLPE